MKDTPLENTFHYTLKRLTDIFLSLLVILFVLSWFIPLMAVLIKLSSKGPVFFIQARSGQHGLPFNCIKLRSMHINDEAHTRHATLNDGRITLIGKFLRKFSLDELPQFFNVLKGEMSMIGPRPHMLYHTETFSEIVDDYMHRHHVKPGITGLSQVMGYRGEISNEYMIKNRVRLDLFYIRHWSYSLDLMIAFKTIRLMLMGS